MPHTYRDVEAPEGTLVCVQVVGEAGGEWFLRREGLTWRLVLDVAGRADSVVTLDQAFAWRLFTKRMDRETARARFPEIQVEGDLGLGEFVLEMVSIVA